MEAIVIQPQSETDPEEVEAEVTASVRFIAGEQRRRRRHGLERDNPSRAAMLLTSLASGVPHGRIRSEFGVSGKTLSRLVADHDDLLAKTRAWRMATATRLALLASRAMEDKLTELVENPEQLRKASLREVAEAYRIATDIQRQVLSEGPAVRQEPRLTLDDARRAIEDAAREVESQVSQGPA